MLDNADLLETVIAARTRVREAVQSLCGKGKKTTFRSEASRESASAECRINTFAESLHRELLSYRKALDPTVAMPAGRSAGYPVLSVGIAFIHSIESLLEKYTHTHGSDGLLAGTGEERSSERAKSWGKALSKELFCPCDLVRQQQGQCGIRIKDT